MLRIIVDEHELYADDRCAGCMGSYTGDRGRPTAVLKLGMDGMTSACRARLPLCAGCLEELAHEIAQPKLRNHAP